MPDPHPSRTPQAGFTLLEMLVAIFMAGVLVTAAMPSLSSSLTAHHLKAASRTTTNYVRVVRSTAISRNAQTRLLLSNNGTTLSTQVLNGASWESVGSPVVLEGGVRVSSVNPSTGIVFHPQGYSVNGASTLTLTATQGSTHVLSVSLLGSVNSS
jgi:prepilin-type N-terminal cleavage/methylation domain-containing protein